MQTRLLAAAALRSHPPRTTLFPETLSDAFVLTVRHGDGKSRDHEGAVFYLHTPAGFGTSKLAARTERALGVDATARNWRTCLTLIELAAELDA